MPPGTRVQFDPTLVRGMGYYTGTIFEIASPAFPSSIAGGGRYDRMVGRLLGRDVPACGFSIGFERLIMILSERGEREAGRERRVGGGGAPHRAARGAAADLTAAWPRPGVRARALVSLDQAENVGSSSPTWTTHGFWGYATVDASARDGEAMTDRGSGLMHANASTTCGDSRAGRGAAGPAVRDG